MTGGGSLKREVITMSASELFQFVIMMTSVISLVYNILKDKNDKK